jgi:hypothetical protein
MNDTPRARRSMLRNQYDHQIEMRKLLTPAALAICMLIPCAPAVAKTSISWASEIIEIPRAKCDPHCDIHYSGDPIPIRVPAPGPPMDKRTLRLECSGNGCQFDHWTIALRGSNIIGIFYSRSEAVSVVIKADLLGPSLLPRYHVDFHTDASLSNGVPLQI